MTRRCNNSLVALNEIIIVTELLPIEDLEDATVEEYKILNNKLDSIMSKIKVRKESKKKKL